MEFLGILFLWWFVVAASLLVYVVVVYVVLRKCEPESWAMNPALVWLLLVPVVGAAWQFVVVRAVSTSLRTEYASRGIPYYRGPGEDLGMAKAVVDAVALLCFVGWTTAGSVNASHPQLNWSALDYICVLLASYTFLLTVVGVILSVVYSAKATQSGGQLQFYGGRASDLGPSGGERGGRVV